MVACFHIFRKDLVHPSPLLGMCSGAHHRRVALCERSSEGRGQAVARREVRRRGQGLPFCVVSHRFPLQTQLGLEIQLKQSVGNQLESGLCVKGQPRVIHRSASPLNQTGPMCFLLFFSFLQKGTIITNLRYLRIRQHILSWGKATKPCWGSWGIPLSVISRFSL